MIASRASPSPAGARNSRSTTLIAFLQFIGVAKDVPPPTAPEHAAFQMLGGLIRRGEADRSAQHRKNCSHPCLCASVETAKWLTDLIASALARRLPRTLSREGGEVQRRDRTLPTREATRRGSTLQRGTFPGVQSVEPCANTPRRRERPPTPQPHGFRTTFSGSPIRFSRTSMASCTRLSGNWWVTSGLAVRRPAASNASARPTLVPPSPRSV